MQTENIQSYRNYQSRRGQMRPPTPQKRRTLNPEKDCRALKSSVDKAEFQARKQALMGRPRGERGPDPRQSEKEMSRAISGQMGRSSVTRSLSVPGMLSSRFYGTNVGESWSVPEAVAEDLAASSGNLAKTRTANTYQWNTHLGDSRRAMQRVESFDFSVRRGNNHFSKEDKLTRSDPYYMKPRPTVTNNSVKYNVISNSRRDYIYGDPPRHA